MNKSFQFWWIYQFLKVFLGAIKFIQTFKEPTFDSVNRLYHLLILYFFFSPTHLVSFLVFILGLMLIFLNFLNA